MNNDLGEITACYKMTFVRRSKHSAIRLWAAITNEDEVSKWMEAPSRIDLRVGGSWFIDFGRSTLDGVIIRVEPERVLAYAWGRSVVEWTIEDSNEGCTYTFVHQGCEDRGEGEEGLPAGWHNGLDQIDLHLDGQYMSKEELAADWERLKPLYRERLETALIRDLARER